MPFLATFIILSIVNVVFSTIRSITTIKSGKTLASIISGGYFAFYNVMLVYTVADFSMFQKCVITFVCNVLGVWVVKLVEEKIRKDKLWKVEASVKMSKTADLEKMLNLAKIPNNHFYTSGEDVVFNIFCATQKESVAVREILKKFRVKYFVTESKVL